MPQTSWQDSGYQRALPGVYKVQVRSDYGTITRTNNSVTVPSLRAQFRAVHVSGATYANVFGTGTKGVESQLPSGTVRNSQTNVLGEGSAMTPNSVYSGASSSPSITVGQDANNTTVRQRFYRSNDGGWYQAGSQNLTIPSLGSPSGDTYLDEILDTILKVRSDVTSWGTNATAGSVRSYIADNASFTNQTYISVSDNVPAEHTGLTPNTQYWLRGWASNGGGKSAYMDTIGTVTLSNATESSKDVQASSASFTLAVAQGYRTTSAMVQYRVQGSGVWVDSSPEAGATPTVVVTGLIPNTTYEYRLAVTTDEGTWYGSTGTFTTLPAGKLVMPNGDVLNAIPRLVMPNGDVEMVNINIVEP